MALAISMIVNFIDEDGDTSFTKIRLPNILSIAQVQQFGQAAAQLMVNITTCRITGASATFAIDLAGLGLKTVASAAAQIAKKAFFQFGTTATGFVKKMSVPCCSELIVLTGTDTLDDADPAVAAFEAAMENGIVVSGPATIQPTDERVHDINSTLIRQKQFRRRIQ